MRGRSYRKIPRDGRTALDQVAELGENGTIRWEIVRALVAQNRKGKFRASECVVSVEKRGTPPDGNNYGLVLDDAGDPCRD